MYLGVIVVTFSLTLSPFQFDTVPDTTGFSNSVTLKGFTMKIEVKKMTPH